MPMANLHIERHQVLRKSFEVLLAIAQEEGIDRLLNGMLEGFGIRMEGLDDTAQPLSPELYARAIDRIGESISIPCLGARLGQRKKSNTFGIFGIGMATGTNLAHTFRFSPWLVDLLWDHSLKFTLLRERGWAIAHYESTWPDHANACRIAVEEVMLGCISVISEMLPDADWSACEVRFRGPAPAHFRLYEALYPCPVLFDQADYQVRIPADWLERPLTQANRTVVDFCESVCQELVNGHSAPATLEQQVRRLLQELPLNPHPTVAEVARQIGMNERTLRCRLACEGVNFRDVLHERKLDLAQQYLTATQMSIKEIAYQLGFSHLPSFYRVFSKEIGMTPENYRIESKTLIKVSI